MDINVIMSQLQATAVDYGIKVIGAFILWLVGLWAINLTVRLVRRALTARHLDSTLQQYLGTIVSVSLNILLIIVILAQFGVQTTSFAAMLAAAGLAIGTAWGGLLANFAAGAFLLVLRPFKVGDYVVAAGMTGTVDEIGLFVTTLITPDGVRTFVGNKWRVLFMPFDCAANLQTIGTSLVQRTMPYER